MESQFTIEARFISFFDVVKSGQIFDGFLLTLELQKCKLKVTKVYGKGAHMK
jgi:hypothetical protein